MAKAEIFAGICGFNTTVHAHKNGDGVDLELHSECKAIQKLASELKRVDPWQEISTRRKVPQTLEMGMKYCTHAACPVPAGIIKAVEVEAGLALPKDVSIKLSKDDEPG
jgi:hypothetical protein